MPECPNPKYPNTKAEAQKTRLYGTEYPHHSLIRFQSVLRNSYATLSLPCARRSALARRVLVRGQEHSCTRPLTRMFSVTDLSCHRGLISSRLHTLSNPTKVVDETICDSMKTRCIA
jgi:hypothetical protein